jgi:guanine deaminase
MLLSLLQTALLTDIQFKNKTPYSMSHANPFLQRAVELSIQGSTLGKGFPFGAVVVRNGEIVGEGHNEVIIGTDPTAHAEVVAIRNACTNLGTYELADCELYTSCEPCPMCLGAIYWAKIPKVYYANTRHDAADIGFDDALIYEEIPLPLDQRQVEMIALDNQKALVAFELWRERE